MSKKLLGTVFPNEAMEDIFSIADISGKVESIVK